jgi:hypothetical protein
MVKELHDIFPRISENSMYRILLSIKQRYEKYWHTWLSRYEWEKFWVSQRQMVYLINYLRESWALITKWKARTKWWQYCLIYTFSDWFKEWLSSVKAFIKKVFTYIDPLSYIKSKVKTTLKRWRHYFNISWNWYFISTRWRFKNVIYSMSENKIVDPLTIT